MSETKNLRKLQTAVELGFLSDEQVGVIEQERKNSNFTAVEVAIRKGYLNRQQRDVLEVFSAPHDVVPGYRVEGMLGAGGAGTVYKATQLGMDRPVAIKTIRQTATRNDLTPKRFEREARIVGQLKHPNIIAAIDFGIHREQLFLVMEFVDGIDAEKYLNQKNRIPELHGWYIALQVCHALQSANQVGVIHRDIKPANMILAKAPPGTSLPPSVPFVNVGDFGLAKFKEPQHDSTITLDRSVSGTPLYMSPEQVQAVDMDHRSDIYSLGITVWHLVEGIPPITGTSPLDVITNKMKLEDTWLSKTPETISDSGFQLLQKMCRFDRDQRIGDYEELTQQIESVIKSLKDSPATSGQSLKPFEAVSTLAKPTTINRESATFTDDEPSVSDGSFDFQQDTVKSAHLIQNTEPGNRTATTKRRSHPAILTTLAVVSLLFLGGFLLWSQIFVKPNSLQAPSNLESQVRPTRKEPRNRLANFAGLPIPLFNGLEMDPTQKFTGLWDVKVGEEGNVLAGKDGTRNFRCTDLKRKQLRNFRFECGFRHHDAERIVFQLIDAEGETQFTVNISLAETILSNESKANMGSQSLQQFDDSTHGFHRCIIESQPDHWRIDVDSKLIGEVDKPTGQTGSQTIQLVVQGPGWGHFESIQIRELKK
jgi:serine/threonine protein kinase